MFQKSDITAARRLVDAKLAQLAMVREQCRTALTQVEDHTAREVYLKEALVTAQAVAQRVQEVAHHRVADVVSRSLEVFDQPYTFQIKFEVKRGKTEASLVFERNGLEVDPLTASGGGVVDVAAFALRLSCLLLSRPPLRRLLVLDEPFKYVSVEYRGRVRDLLTALAEELDCQFIIVTHMDELKIGKVVHL